MRTEKCVDCSTFKYIRGYLQMDCSKLLFFSWIAGFEKIVHKLKIT